MQVLLLAPIEQRQKKLIRIDYRSINDYVKTQRWEVSEMNYEMQYYKGIPIRLINRQYGAMKAKRFTINNTNQNVWIPNKHLTKDGTVREGDNLDYIFRKAVNQLNIAGITHAIPSIKFKKRG